MFKKSFRPQKSLKTPAVRADFAVALLLSSGAGILTAQIHQDVPRSIQQAIDVGAVNPGEEVNITVHLEFSNKPGFDKAVEALYDPESPQYERWLTDADLKAYAPSVKAVAAVKTQLLKNGLTVISEDPLGFSIRAHGTLSSVQQAFQTEIHQYTLNGRTFRGHVQPAVLTGGAHVYVHTVSGLDGAQARPLARAAINPRTGKALARIPLAKMKTSAGGLYPYITDNCVTAPADLEFTGSTPLPTAVYFGNMYDADSSGNPNSRPCSFTPAQLQVHYGLPAAYAKGFDGTGHTLVLLEAYGYPTIQADANAFFALAGLPALDSTNFEVVYPEGKPKNPNAGVELGWDVEIAVDLQWSHTIAPKAKIIVVAAASQDNEDFQDAINYVVKNKLASVISNSWEADVEQFAGPLEVESFNTVLQAAAAKGVSVNFSSGDNGDEGNGMPLGAPDVPADSPYATAVGGTSILKSVQGTTVESGWGNVQTELADGGPLDPPHQFGFVGGAGGGESVFFNKPAWQKGLPGTGRQEPDVSALADPYTGVPIVVTSQGQQYLQPGLGGTSLACPIFSAFWVLANQAAGHSLGQAAPHIAQATGKQMTDIVPMTSPANVSGIVIDSAGSTYYSPLNLVSLGVEPPTVDFLSTIWPVSSQSGTEYLVLGFGLDTSLSLNAGWDNITGFGVPNGLTFIQGFK